MLMLMMMVVVVMMVGVLFLKATFLHLSKLQVLTRDQMGNVGEEIAVSAISCESHWGISLGDCLFCPTTTTTATSVIQSIGRTVLAFLFCHSLLW